METKKNIAWQTLLVASTLVFGAVAAFCEPQQLSEAAITQVEVVRAGQKTVVRVAANRPLVSQTMRLSDPERLVLDFSGAHLAIFHSSLPTALPPIRGVRVGQFRPDVARVVIDLERAVPYRVLTQETSITVELDVAASAPVRNPKSPVTPVDYARHPASTLPAETNASTLRAAADTNLVPRADSSTQRAASLAALVPPENESAPVENSFESGMLTFRAQNQALGSVIKQIGDQAGVSIYLADGLGNEQLSVEFRHYRLDEAIRQMLKDYDVLFLYDPVQDGQGTALQAVWIYPAGHAQAPRPLPEISWTTVKEVTPTQACSNPDLHAEAVTGPKESDPVAELLKALQDRNDDVREQALSRALTAKAQIPQETLVNLALADASAKVRLLALKALPLNPDLRWVAERAEGDVDQSVIEAAREALRAQDFRERAESWAASHIMQASPDQ